MDNIQPIKYHLDVERKIIHLMLTHLHIIEEMIEGGFSPDFFEGSHRPIVDAAIKEFTDSAHKRLLTRESYKQYLASKGLKDTDIYTAAFLHDECLLGVDADVDDLGSLKKQLVESYIARKSQRYLADFADTCKKKSYLEAAQELSHSLLAAVSVTETRRVFYGSGEELKDDYIKELEALRNEDARIRCGIDAVDTPITYGFKPQHLTLFVADTGGHKTNMMLNIGLNIAERGHGVLFIPLEMSRYDIMNRIVANRTGIPMEGLTEPKTKLSDEDMAKIVNDDLWVKSQRYFHILDADERTSVMTLKHEIESKASKFKPKVVIIDYVDTLETDAHNKYGQRHIEIGTILKDLRFLGKRYGFHIISAAQMNRSAIRAWKDGKQDAIDSTSIHGSHQYSADSDTIFVLLPHKDEDDKIKVHVVKARHGRSGQTYEVRIDPACCLITNVSEIEHMAMATEFDTDAILDTPEGEIKKEITAGINFAGAPDLQLPDDDDDEVAKWG